MSRVLLKGALVVVMLGFLISSPGWSSQYSVTPSVYKITVNKVELYNADTDQWVTIGEGNVTFDIASVTAGGIVGGYVSGKPIPEGTYTKIRITVSRHMRIKAHINVGGTDYYTGPVSQDFDLNSGPGEDIVKTVVATTNANTYCEGEVVSPSTSNGIHYQVTGDYFTDTQTFSSPVVVKKGLNKKIKIKFDVTGAATFYDGDNITPPWGTTPFFLPGAPTISVEME